MRPAIYTRLCSGGLRRALDILKVSGNASHSSDQEKKLQRCCTTITTLRGTTDMSGRARNPIPSPLCSS
jgi:hypothetical protein